jgi:L-asparaginase
MDRSITVVTTGGTIASIEGNGGATPELSGADLIDSVPAIGDHADLTVEQPLQRSSFDMDTAGMARMARSARSAAESGTSGIVVTHGTDTMEESAYYLDLVCELPVPIVFTGAQRRPDEVSPDGPANLLTAIRAASHDFFAGEGGVYLAFDGEVHAARNVTKTHTSALDAFVSPDSGPIAAFDHAGFRPFRAPGSRSDSIRVTETTMDVPIVRSATGASGTLLRSARESGVDGVVLEGTGLGNTTGALAKEARKAIEAGTPVVITSRCPGGRVAPVYGGPGGGETLREMGVIDGGALPAHKARLKLMLVLEAVDTSSQEAVKNGFEPHQPTATD